MDDAQLKRSLQGIGKTCFVKYYKPFRDKSRTDPSFLVNFLMRAGVSNEAGAKIRVGRDARGIFNEGRENDALKIVVKSARVPPEIRDKARLLLNGGSALPPRPRPPRSVGISPACEMSPKNLEPLRAN